MKQRKNSQDRLDALVDAICDVCCYCGGRAVPDIPEARKVYLMQSGTYSHFTYGAYHACPASPIWVRYYWELSSLAADVEAEKKRKADKKRPTKAFEL